MTPKPRFPKLRAATVYALQSSRTARGVAWAAEMLVEYVEATGDDTILDHTDELIRLAEAAGLSRYSDVFRLHRKH